MTEKIERREVCFQGRVQGVGFRYSTVRVARGYQVTGYVMNLPDGSVQLVVEGVGAVLDEFVADVEETMSGFIQRTDKRKLPATGAVGSYDVTYC